MMVSCDTPSSVEVTGNVGKRDLVQEHGHQHKPCRHVLYFRANETEIANEQRRQNN